MEVFFIKRPNLFTSVKLLTIAAMLTAMSVVIGIFCKSALNFGGGLFRITFENLPIILAGVMFGPISGGVVGGVSDIVSYLLSGQAYPPNLIVTLGAVVIGVIAGGVSRFLIKKRCSMQVIAAGVCAHVVGSMIIKSIGLFVFYGWAVLWRIPTYTVITFIEILIICLLYKNKTFCRLLHGVDRAFGRTDAEDRA